MKVARILEDKGHNVVTVAPADTVADALRLLVRHNIGSLVVMDGGRIAGIITERDILRLADRDPSSLGGTTVDQAMTKELIVASATDDVSQLMKVMTRNRVRHLPIVDDGSLRGIVSIGDLVNAVRTDAEAENRHLRAYVRGAYG
jgi:CBS domain-containing protein